MPLQPSGAISMSEIRTEFGGGTGSIAINAFYRGGARVPNDAFCHNNTIPASGQIDFGGFRATTNGANITTYTATTNITPPTNTVRFQGWAVGGGGGGARSRNNSAAAARNTRHAAGGGGGHHAIGTQACNQANGEFVRVEIGAGGAAANSTATSGALRTGGAGGSGVIRRRASNSTNLQNWSAGGGGGGRANANNNFSAGGTAGAGTTNNGLVGAHGAGNATRLGGNSGNTTLTGRGGNVANAGASPGGAGRIRIRF